MVRTEYELWKWDRPNVGGDRAGQFGTVQEAMGHAGYGDAGDWRETASGALCLRDEIEEQLGFRAGQPFAISEVLVPETDGERIELAVKLALEDGQVDGDHHKMWVIDQMLRLLAGDRYEELIAGYCDGKDGPDTYTWDEGIAP